MTDENPYASPGTSREQLQTTPSAWKYLAKWAALVGLNSLAMLFMFVAYLTMARGGDSVGDSPLLPPSSKLQILAAFAIFVVALASLDLHFAHEGRIAPSRILTYGATVKALLQPFFWIIDACILESCANFVKALPDQGGPLAPLLASLLCGITLIGTVFGLGFFLFGWGMRTEGHPPPTQPFEPVDRPE